MGSAGEVQLHIKEHPESPKDASPAVQQPSSIFKHWKWWLILFLCTISVLAGQTIATLLGRLYYNDGGTSLWVATLVQSAGSPLLLIPYLLLPNRSPHPLTLKLLSIYLLLGLLIGSDNLMYSYGLLYLPVSTYSLICATQLAFNAVFSFFLNSQKFTPLIFNSVVLLTFSAALLGVAPDSETSSNMPKGKYFLGFILTLAASATYSLILSLMQRTFEKVVKRENFYIVLEMQVYTNIVAALTSVVGLFGSGDWRRVSGEMDGFQKGRVAYVMVLVGTALAWQICAVGVIGLIFVVSSLFSNVISTLALPIVPVFAVVFFHDGMNGVKVVAMLIAVWGFLSYMYQHYVDDLARKEREKVDGL